MKCKWCDNKAIAITPGHYEGYCGRKCKALHKEFRNGFDLMKLQKKPQLNTEQRERFQHLLSLTATDRYFTPVK